MPDQPPIAATDFDGIFEALRARIPRYLPEWTDFNESDPGITFLELVAVVTESLIWRLGRVPDALEARLLELMGLRARPAAPAQVALTFVPDRVPVVGIVPKGSQVAGPGADGEPVVFETLADLAPTSTELVAVQTFDGARFEDVTALAEDPAITFRPFGRSPAPGSALYLGFAVPSLPQAPVFPAELRFRLFLPQTQGQPVRVGAGSGLPPVVPAARFVVEACDDASRRHFRALAVRLDETAAFTVEGDIVCEGPRWSVPLAVGPVRDDLHWLRFRLTDVAYPSGREPTIDALLANTVMAEARNRVSDEYLGASSGRPDQVFRLRNAPVAPESLLLQLFVAGQTEDWTRLEDLWLAEPDEAAFRLDEATGEITFGDGVHGRIPPAGAEIVAAAYRYGGGTAGNLAAGSIGQVLSGLIGISGVANRRDARGGADRQSAEALRKQAPRLLRALERAVTADDYESLASALGQVHAARAIPLMHPDYPGVDVPGAVTIVVVPDGNDRRPIPPPDLLRAVAGWLERFRTIGTELVIKGPELTEVAVRARLEVRPEANFAAVLDRAQQRLNQFLDARAWPFGRDLHPTRLYAVLLDDPGQEVVAVSWLALVVAGAAWSRLDQPVALPRDGLFYPGQHDLVAAPAVDL